jgi:hypothetical protein
LRSISGSGLRTAEVALFGSLDGVGSGVVNALGQQIDVSGLGIETDALLSHVGKLVYIEGKLVDRTFKATALEAFDEYAVPGVSPVIVKGPLDSVDGTKGQVSIGALKIDVNNVQQISAAELGETVVIGGTQPVPQGLILADSRQ